ncbi:MAG: hypothetical protein V2A71_03620, partial [Candidatus Eisenbacteria bacterium]
MLTQPALKMMDEKALRQEIVMPLLTAMGFRDVYEYHGGTGEQGKDIVCWKPNDLEVRKNLAVIVKATQLSGRAKVCKGAAGEVQTQIRQCFGSPYTDHISCEERCIHEVWVVSNKKISKEAIKAIKGAVADPRYMHNVTFIAGDTLWKLVKKWLPVG